VDVTSHLYLIDSSIWIRVLRESPLSSELADRVRTLVDGRAVAVNDLIRVEVLIGSRDEIQFQRVERTFAALVRFPIERGTWTSASDLGFSMRIKGVKNAPDLVIAASALEHEAVVMHADRDFDTIAAHSDLRVESYVGVDL